MKTISDIPASSRAALAADGRGSISVVTRTTPVPEMGQVLVRMAAAPVNPTDINLVHNYSGNPRRYPLPAGREGSGQVVASGGGFAANFLLGRRVAVFGGSSGTWSEYTTVSATACVPLRASLSYEQGSMLLINPLTALALIRYAKENGYRTIVNTAAGGGFGDLLRAMARRYRLTLVDIVRRDEHARELKSAGALHVLNSADPDFSDHLERLCRELDARLFLDTIGGMMTEHLVEASPRGSTIILYGVISRQNPTFSGYRLLNDGKRIEGFYLSNWVKQAGMIRLWRTIFQAQAFLSSSFQFRIGSRFLLSEIETALSHARQKASTGKALIVLDPDRVSMKGEKTG